MMHNTVRVTLTTCLMMGISTLIPGARAILLADCNEGPSFVQVTERNCGSCGVESTLDSRTPGNTIYLDWTAVAAERQVFHGGDVEPGTKATFTYIDVATGASHDHLTQNSRPNGVIHHQAEFKYFAGSAGVRWEVVASWIDECGAGAQTLSIGFVEMQ